LHGFVDTVIPHCADQNQQTRSDCANGFPRNSDFGFFYTLDHCAH